MSKKAHVVAIAVAVLAGGLILTLWPRGDRKPPSAGSEEALLRQTIAELEQRIDAATSERDAARRQLWELQAELAGLAEARAEDRQVIKDLWAMLTGETRQEKRPDAKGIDATQTSDADDPTSGRQDQKDDAKYDIASVREMLAASGGNLESAVHEIVTAEGIDSILEKYGDRPVYWTAAASLAADPETAMAYLEEAVKIYPDSPAVLSAFVGARIAAGKIDESTLAYVSELQNADPTNALGDCYEAYCQFEDGDVAGALQSLSEASDKGRFADDRIGMLMARYDCLLDEGASDTVALGLSAFTLPLEHLGMVKNTGQQSIAQAQSLSAAGQLEEALKIAQDVTNIGRTLSSSGRFLLHDRVGIALQQAGLAEQQQIYNTLGDIQGMEETGTQLQAIQERSATIDTMVQSFGAVLANMTEEDLAGYVDSTILKGEFATLQDIPEIAQAVNQPPPTLPEALAEAVLP